MADALPETVTRKSVPLTQRDLDDIAKLRGDRRARTQLAVLAHAPVTETTSDAALLHTVLRAGLQAVQDRIDEESYRAEAADRAWQAEQRRISRRPRAVRGLADAE